MRHIAVRLDQLQIAIRVCYNDVRNLFERLWGGPNGRPANFLAVANHLVWILTEKQVCDYKNPKKNNAYKTIAIVCF